MKIFTAPLLVSLVIINLQITETRTETTIDLIIDMATSTLPCVAPCVLEHYEKFLPEAYIHCILPVQSKFKEAGNLTTPPFGSNQVISPTPQLAVISNILGILKPYCPYVGGVLTCLAEVTTKHCGRSLGDKLLSQGQKLEENLSCGDKFTKGSVFNCLTSPSAREVEERCFYKLVQDRSLTASLASVLQGYGEIYKKVLTPPASTPTEPPMICKVITTQVNCLIDNHGILNLPECNEDALSNLDKEINGILDLINCRAYKKENDGLTCLAKPDLILDQIQPCINMTDLTALINNVDLFNEGLKGLFNIDKMCEMIQIMDTCLKENFVNEPACQPDGWVLETYRAATTPLRDYIINEHCQNLKKHPFNARGAGTCKNTFTNYTYGEPVLPVPISASSRPGSTLQLLATIFTTSIMGILYS